MINNLSIIIVTYNVADKILDCINPIKDLKHSEIIIIDNASKDQQKLESIIRISKIIKLVNNKKNVGFASAVNQGIKTAKNKDLLLLNPDTIPNKKSISILQKFLNSRENIGLVGGRMTEPGTGRIHGTCVDRPTFLVGLFDFTNLKKIFKNNKYTKQFYYTDKLVDKPKKVWGLSGGFLMFRKSLSNEVGFFDENFFLYLEDVDFGVRVRMAGYDNYYLPKAKIVHDSGSSSANSLYNIDVKAWRHSRRYYANKYFRGLKKWTLNLVFFLDASVTDLYHLLSFKPLS